MRLDFEGSFGGPYARMKPIARPALPYEELAGGSADAQSPPQNDALDKLRDKVVVKGPSRDTSGFQLQYVHVADFRFTWLERGDEVHLVPYQAGVKGQPRFIFSSPAEDSFMVTVQPTRASVNAQVYTNIPDWKGKPTVEYIGMLEERRKTGNTSLSRYLAPQSASGDRNTLALVRVESRRQMDGWWVYIYLTPMPWRSGRALSA